MSDQESDFRRYIERVKKAGSAEYGTQHFMPPKHEHWKFLWASDHITELEAQVAELEDWLNTIISDGERYCERSGTTISWLADARKVVPKQPNEEEGQ
jgi:hypothetical protein